MNGILSENAFTLQNILRLNALWKVRSFKSNLMHNSVIALFIAFLQLANTS